ALREAIERFAAHDPRGQALLDHLAIDKALANKKAADALAIAQNLLAATKPPARDEAAELHYLEARAAALVDGQLDLARSAAQTALQTWQAERDARGAWHAVYLHYVIANVHYHAGSKSDALPEFESGSKLAIAAFGADSAARI